MGTRRCALSPVILPHFHHVAIDDMARRRKNTASHLGLAERDEGEVPVRFESDTDHQPELLEVLLQVIVGDGWVN